MNGPGPEGSSRPPTPSAEDPDRGEPSALAPAAAERAAALVGRVISERYRIDKLLAMGGMGAVYRGHHLHLKKRVAVKVLHPETENLPELVSRFQREAIAGAHVSHANVAAATDFGQLEDGSYFLVLEYVSGKTLRQLVKEGPVPAARAANIARQLAAGLSAVHAMGIVHRDVKPQNVMLVEGKEDCAKLIDFGLAKVPVERVVSAASIRPPAAASADGKPSRRARLDSLLDDKPRLTDVGTVVGTVAYLAPEAALGMDAVDARSDLYALGLVLYLMLAGRPPFDSADDAALFAHQRFTPPPPFAARAPGVRVPAALEAVVMRLLAKDPAARYPTGAAVIEALDAAMSPPAGAEPRGYAAVAVGATAVAVGVAAALLFNTYAVGHDGGGPRPPPNPPGFTPTPPGFTPTPPGFTPNRPGFAPTPPGFAPTPPGFAPTPRGAPVLPPGSSSASRPQEVAPEPATVAPAAAAPERTEASAQRSLLLRALRVRDWNGGEAAFLDLVERDPSVFRAPDLALAARDLAVALDREGKGDRLFDALTNRLGPAGLDVLYDLVATKGRAGAATRAATILRQREVIARAGPELRIAFALREAPCVDKLGLLDRAAAEGDGRALVVLQTQGAACFKKNNRAVLESIQALRSRLSHGSSGGVPPDPRP